MSVGNDVFIKDGNGAYHTINGSYSNVFHVYDNNLILHSLNTSAKSIGFNSSFENYGFNYAITTRQWILHNNIYYSENGYTWTVGGGLIEESTALWGWNNYPYPLETQNPFGEAPVLLKVGVIADKLYWIEASSGFLFEYDTVNDVLTQKFRLYSGDGMHSTGIANRDTLKPVIVNGGLFYSSGSVVHYLNLETGYLIIFYASPGEVVRYD